MLKPNVVAIDQSNIAKLSSNEHHEAQRKSAETEAEWKGAGQKEGVEVWRVYNFKVNRVPESQIGTFYSGDSYIILRTLKTGPAFKYDLFFWLGSKTSQDEMGTAAYKTVELDEFLNGAPIQYREVQGNESESFLKVFGGQIKLLEGGMDSGFNHVKPETYRPRLLHLKGKRLVRVTEVPLALSSMNEGDAYVLDAGLDLYLWTGPSAGVFEKRKGNDVIEEIKNERLGKAKSVLIDGYDDHPQFWKLLGGKGKAQPAIPDDDTQPQYNHALFRLSDASGELKFSEVGNVPSSKKLARSLLSSDDVFILDSGIEIFVWVGKGTTANEKREAIPTAVKYLQQKNRPTNTPIKRLIEGGETDAWKNFFD